MGLLCQCPVGAEIIDIPIENCIESVGQIQKLVFQRVYNGATKNKFTIASANPNLKASWDTLLAASDSTKAVQTPFIQGPEVEPGEAVTFGGGNETLGGIEKITAVDPTTFTAQFHTISQKSIAAIKQYMCEIVGVYMIDEHGRIIGLTDDLDTPTEFYPIPIAENTLFIGDKKLGGRVEPDMNAIRFQLLPNWSDKLHIVTPSDFSALTDLVTP